MTGGPVVTIGAAASVELLEEIAFGARFVRVADAGAALKVIAGELPRLVVIGGDVDAAAARDLLAAAQALHPDARHLAIVTAATDDLDQFQPLVAADLVFYLCRAGLRGSDLRRLTEAALDPPAARDRSPGGEGPLEPGEKAALIRELNHHAPRVAAARSLSDAAATLRSVASALVAAEHRCLFFDAERDTLWTGEDAGGREADSAATGLGGFVVRTRAALAVVGCDQDPRYDPDADNPAHAAAHGWAGLPLVDPRHEVAGVLVAVRDASAAPFTPGELFALQSLAHLAAPHIRHLLLLRRADREAVALARDCLRHPDLFRSEALAAYQTGLRGASQPLQLAGRWTPWAFWVLLLAVAGFLAFAAVGTIREYASGPALVRAEGCLDVHAARPGVVESILVEPGQAVSAGTPLAQLHGTAERAEYARSEQEFALDLSHYFREPGDPAVRQRLSELRTRREFARTRLDDLKVKAPRAGVVDGLRVRPGQHVAEGEALLSVCGPDAAFGVVALLPGAYRPQLKEGETLMLELAGYEHSRQRLVIDRVGAALIDAADAWRFVGQTTSAADAAHGPVVLVHATLPAGEFSYRGRRYRHHDGMRGLAEVPVRRERILLALLPALGRLTERP